MTINNKYTSEDLIRLLNLWGIKFFVWEFYPTSTSENSFKEFIILKDFEYHLPFEIYDILLKDFQDVEDGMDKDFQDFLNNYKGNSSLKNHLQENLKVLDVLDLLRIANFKGIQHLKEFPLKALYGCEDSINSIIEDLLELFEPKKDELPF